MAGMIGSGQAMRTNALQSMQRYSSLDAKMRADRDQAEAMNEQAETQQNTSLGAAAGGAVGGLSAGPVGMVIGAVIGGIAGSLF